MAQETLHDENITATWARFVSELTYDDLPEDVRRTLRWLALDTFATTLAANTLGIGIPQLVSWARAAGGAPQATLMGLGDKLPAVCRGDGQRRHGARAQLR